MDDPNSRMEGIVKGEQQHGVEYAHSMGSNLSDSPTEDDTTVPDCCKADQIQNNIPRTTTQESSPPSSQENHPIKNNESKNLTTGRMSESEVKIRHELETDVERDLEEELKDGIYHLALRLHRLYQHKRESNARQNNYWSNKGRIVNKKICGGVEEEEEEMVTEVNMSIKMEGGTKIEIKETKGSSSSGAALRAPSNDGGGDRNGRCRPKDGILGNRGVSKSICWERTLRSGKLRSEQKRKARARGKVDGDEGKSHNQTWKL